MTTELRQYLENNGWKQCCGGWDLSLNSECYATIKAVDDGYIYGEDCPDVRIPIENFFPDLFFESEDKLIGFLERLKSKNKP